MNSPRIGLDGLWRSQPSFKVPIFSTKRSKACSSVKAVLFSVKASSKRSLKFSLFFLFLIEFLVELQHLLVKHITQVVDTVWHLTSRIKQVNFQKWSSRFFWFNFCFYLFHKEKCLKYFVTESNNRNEWRQRKQWEWGRVERQLNSQIKWPKSFNNTGKSKHWPTGPLGSTFCSWDKQE